MTPQFRIIVDRHQDVTAAIRERLLSLRVSDEEGYNSDAVEIRLDDRGGTVDLPRRGAELTVELGYDKVPEAERRNGLKPGRVRMGRYTVDEVELSGPPATLAIRAKAADMRAALKQRRTRSWRDVLLGDLVRTIAREYGLDPRVAEELAKIVLPHVDQTDESDLHLLTRLGERYDAAARPANGRLVFARRGAAMSAASGPVTAVRIAREQAGDYRVTLADRPGYRSVRAYWYDTAAGRRVEVTAGDGEPVYALRDDHADEATARAAAKARLDALERGSATLGLTLKPGVPTVSAESPLTLSGFRNGVDGLWIAARVSHEIDNSGYSTRVEAGTPTAG
ncbi:MAG: contractile injection system protein, VgrG/Pvc8 family [Bryobacterales bacterium]|nr:contractile injection system protein, VgrG/Pvc8 family [Bryobacterales bacterium]